MIEKEGRRGQVCIATGYIYRLQVSTKEEEKGELAGSAICCRPSFLLCWLALIQTLEGRGLQLAI